MINQHLKRAAFALAIAATGCALDASETSESYDQEEGEVAASSQPIVDNSTIIPLASRTTLERAIVRVPGCTATLLRPNWVLTAKHCVALGSGLPKASVQVTHDSGVSQTSSNIFLHPDPVVDAALIRLNSNMNVGQQASVPLFSGVESSVIGQTVTTYGYGGVPDLSRATLTVSGIENNGSMQGSQRYNRRYLTIAGTVPGDSGGPSFRGGAVVAITGGNPYKAYTRSFRDWANSLISPATNNHLGSKTSFYNNVGPNGSIVISGDVNGDGYTDIVQFNHNSAPVGNVYVIPGTATGFGTMALWRTAFSSGTQVPAVGDVNGDGRADIVRFETTGLVYTALSSGTSFGAPAQWHSNFSFSGEIPRVADMNGDGRADIVTFAQYGLNNVWVGLSCGTNAALYPSGCTATNSFGPRTLWKSQFSASGEVPYAGDVDGDGLGDLVSFKQSTAQVFVSKTIGQSCSNDSHCSSVGGACATALGYCWQSMGIQGGAKQTWSSAGPRTGETPMIADMNGDGKIDVANFETTTAYGRHGFFGVMLSTGTSLGTYATWGSNMCFSGQRCFTGDIRGDGRADVVTMVIGGQDHFALSLPN